jgi:hypothetical protein
MKNKFLLLALCFGACSVALQAQSFDWAKQLNTPSGSATVVSADLDKNVISAGYYYDSIDMDPGVGFSYATNSTSLYTSFLSKLDSSGNYVWGKVFQTPGEVRIIDIDVDQQNNILVAGQFIDSVDLDFGPGVQMFQGSFYSVEHSIFVAKYDPSGNFIWGNVLNTFGISLTNKLHVKAIKVDPANNVVLFGDFTSAADFDPSQGIYVMNNTNLFGDEDQYLLKMSSSGNFLWARQWGAKGFWNTTWWSSSNMLDIDQSGNIFFPLGFTDSVDVDPELGINFVANQGLVDVSLLKISPSGSLVWHREVAGTGSDYCNALSVDPSGNIFYLFNTSTSSIDVDPGSGQVLLNQSSGWAKAILKFNNNGSLQWGKENLPGWSNGWWDEGIAADIFGDVYVYSKISPSFQNNLWDLDPGPGIFTVSSAGITDIAIQNLDGNGNFIWGGVIGGNSQDYCFSLDVDHAEGVYFTGYSLQKADLNPFADSAFFFSTGYSTDPYILKLKSCNKFNQVVFQSCDSVFYDGQYYLADTIIESKFTSSTNCDSVFSVRIDVHPSFYDTLVIDTCKFYVWNGTTYINSGIYSSLNNSVYGCDSNHVLDLTIQAGTTQTVNLSDCDSASFGGVFYSSTGQYQQQYTSSQGCDSNFLINFTQIIIDTSVVFANNTTLISNAIGVTYQWIDCSTMLPVPGATSATLNTMQAGSYACILSQGSCVDTTGCYNLSEEPNLTSGHKILSRLYPNPSKDIFHLVLSRNYKNVELEVRSIEGQLIWEKYFDNISNTNIHFNASSGVYILSIKQDSNLLQQKLIKW